MRNSGLLLLSAVFLMALSACSDIEGGFDDSTPTAPPYRFEPNSRAVLEPLQIESSKHPKVALRAAGRLFVLGVYTEDNLSRLGLFSSRNGGDSFAPPVPLSEPGANLSSHGENSPSVVFGNAREMYVLWEQETEGEDTELMFARSLDLGHRFDKPFRVTDKEVPSRNGFSSLSVAPNGDVYASWLDGRDDDGSGGTSVYIAKSTDLGESFEPNIRVAEKVCECCRPPVAFGNDGEVFVSWRHVFEGNIRDMVVATSLDGGKAFAPPVRVAEDNWEIKGCPHSGPTLLQVGDRLYIAWFTGGGEAEPGIRLSWSDDGGASFAPAVSVSSGIVYANHPVLSQAFDARVLLVFEGRAVTEEDEWGPVTAYVVEINDKGEVGEPSVAPGNGVSITYPVAAGDNQKG
ncbi:glycoside hydrolase, partial [Acidobacteria bacterium AH-259-D05]|nr:glycoside hydrolase [Acidobacteria bacterium AH-259-D05]